MPPDTDPNRYATRTASPRGFDQAYVHEGVGGAGPVVAGQQTIGILLGSQANGGAAAGLYIGGVGL